MFARLSWVGGVVGVVLAAGVVALGGSTLGFEARRPPSGRRRNSVSFSFRVPYLALTAFRS
ncbi:MAG TPA: hypothetical protein VEP28_05405, partial [Rubrobacter sp.]|nr:hypothetical protein [Rubrobacter sp.]